MSKTHSRLKRIPPERNGPIRNPLIGAGPAPPPTPGPTPAAALRGALECGVRSAYAVIDEYLKRGYEAARQNNHQQNGRDYMNGEKPNYGTWSNPWGPMAPLFDQWSAAMRMWAEMWAPFLPGSRQGAWPWPATGGAPYAGSYGAAAAAPQPVSVKVASKRPTEVTVNLKPGADMTQATADSFAPPLVNSVSLDCKGGVLSVSVAIADNQPPGRYSGVLRGADGSVAGDLTVVITGPAA
jgi:hypothetical protein